MSLGGAAPVAGHAHADAGLLVTSAVLALLTWAWWTNSMSRTESETRRHWLGWAGWASCALVLVTPVHGWAERSVAWHMGQHLVLMMIAAPFLAAARVPSTLVPSTRLSQRRVWGALRPIVRFMFRAPAGVAWVAQFVVLWAWHAPIAFVSATTIPWMHAAQHATFLGAATWYWASVFRGFSGSATPSTGRALLSLFGSALHSSVLGAFLALAQDPVYVVAHGEGFGRATLEDQQLAGLLMWIPGSVGYLIAAVLLVGRLTHARWQREPRIR